MTLDNGWALIISTMIGVVLIWIGNLVVKHFGNNEEVANGAHALLRQLSETVELHEKEFLQYQKHVSETYARIPSIERMETNIYASLLRLEAKVDKLQERSMG